MPRLVLISLLASVLLVGCGAAEFPTLVREGTVQIPIPEVTVVVLTQPRLN